MSDATARACDPSTARDLVSLPSRGEQTLLAVNAGARGSRGWTLSYGNLPVAWITRTRLLARVEIRTASRQLRLRRLGPLRRTFALVEPGQRRFATVTPPRTDGDKPGVLELADQSFYAFRRGERGQLELHTPDGRHIMAASGNAVEIEAHVQAAAELAATIVYFAIDEAHNRHHPGGP